MKFHSEKVNQSSQKKLIMVAQMCQNSNQCISMAINEIICSIKQNFFQSKSIICSIKQNLFQSKLILFSIKQNYSFNQTIFFSINKIIYSMKNDYIFNQTQSESINAILHLINQQKIVNMIIYSIKKHRSIKLNLVQSNKY